MQIQQLRLFLGNDLRVYEDLAPLDTPTPYAVWQTVAAMLKIT